MTQAHNSQGHVRATVRGSGRTAAARKRGQRLGLVLGLLSILATVAFVSAHPPGSAPTRLAASPTQVPRPEHTVIKLGPGAVTDLAVSPTSIWAVVPQTSSLVEIAQTDSAVRRRVELARSGVPEHVAFDQDLWVTVRQRSGSDASLLRIDPSSGVVTATIALPASSPPLDVATGFGRIWVLGAESLVVVDPTTAQLATVNVGPRASHMIVAHGSVWVAGGGELRRVDPTANAVVARIPLGGGVTGLAASVDRLVAGVNNYVALVDPKLNALSDTVFLGARADGLAGISDVTWIAARGRVFGLVGNALKPWATISGPFRSIQAVPGGVWIGGESPDAAFVERISGS